MVITKNLVIITKILIRDFSECDYKTFKILY